MKYIIIVILTAVLLPAIPTPAGFSTLVLGYVAGIVTGIAIASLVDELWRGRQE